MSTPDGFACSRDSDCASNCCYGSTYCEAQSYCAATAAVWWIYVIWIVVSVVSCIVCVIIIVCIVRACNRQAEANAAMHIALQSNQYQ